MKNVTLLGASGSIGSSAISFLRLHRDRFKLKSIAVRRDWQSALALSREFGCKNVGIEDPEAARRFSAHSAAGAVNLLAGPLSAVRLAADPVDVLIAAIPGAQGLPSVLAAVDAGNRVALANKESLVCGGPDLLRRAAQCGAPVIPIDSEHSAIYQALLAGDTAETSSILLTASGGPFRTATIEQMKQATPEQALAHPNWRMGVKNSIDSATLANKGLELIEAAYLFKCQEHMIDVVIHPASILHGAACYCDGTMVAQLGLPDMRAAVGYGISWPSRMETGIRKLSLAALCRLEFEDVDPIKFPTLQLAREALRLGPGGALMFNAANEAAVAAFMARRIGLCDIASVIDMCLHQDSARFHGALDDIPRLCAEAIAFCDGVLQRRFS